MAYSEVIFYNCGEPGIIWINVSSPRVVLSAKWLPIKLRIALLEGKPTVLLDMLEVLLQDYVHH